MQGNQNKNNIREILNSCISILDTIRIDYNSTIGPRTTRLMQKIKDKGVQIEEVTLQVGLGTFRPVAEENALEHKMHSEEIVVSAEVAERLNKAKAEGKRIIAVGTTSTRTLETIMNLYGEFKEFGLYIFTKDDMTAEDLLAAMKWTMELQAKAEKQFTTLYISEVQTLYVCDVATLSYKQYPISSEMCKNFFIKSV